MRISNVSNVSFRRVFTPSEKKEADSVREKAMELLGNKRVIFIVPEQSMPVDTTRNIGIGQLNSKTTLEFIETMKTYTGMNTLKVLPQGELWTPQSELYCNYDASALTLGSHTINLEELASEKMGKILSNDTLEKVFENSKKTGTVGVANFENVIGNESMQTVALKEAFENFQNTDSPIVKEMRKEFEKYKLENDFLDKRAYYEILSEKNKSIDYTEWVDDIDKNLFNTDKVTEDIRNKRIAELKSKHSKEIDFVYFKQYLADKNLANAKSEINSKGVNLMGDCLIGFSYDNIWAYPKAFEDANICTKEWNIRSLNYSELTKEGSESNKLLKLKVKQFAKRYDEIRFDVGWCYVDPILHPLEGKESTLEGRYYLDSKSGGYKLKESLNDDVIKIIENTVKEVKGKDYNLDNLIYEIEAGPKDFSAYDWEKMKVKDALKNRTIVQSNCYMSDDYATIDFMEKKMGVARKNYVYMSGNHDHIALNALASKIDNDGMLKANGDNIEQVFEKQIRPLAKGLNITESEIKASPKNFIKSKFSYNFLAENVKMFFMDVFGRADQFDSQAKNSAKNYRQMVASDYEAAMQESIQKGKGLNIMEALAMAMKGKNLDESNKELYNNLLKYSDILKEETPSEPAAIRRGPKGDVKPTGGKKNLMMYGIMALGILLAGGIILLKKLKNKQQEAVK